MSRSVDRDDGQRSKEETHSSRATVAESRGGGNGSSTPNDERHDKGRGGLGMSIDDSVLS